MIKYSTLPSLLKNGLINLEVKSFLESSDAKKILLEDGKDIKIHADKFLHGKLSELLSSIVKIPILSEEIEVESFDYSKAYWVIDPLDGTFNFNRSIPICCISIALIEKGRPTFGFIYDFNNDHYYWGGKNLKSFLNGDEIFCSKTTALSDAAICTGIPLLNSLDGDQVGFVDVFRKVKKVRMLGSAAMSLCYVASGKVDAYTEEAIRLWDVAAGIAIVEGSGGKVSYQSIDDDPSVLNVFASNGELEQL